MKRSAMSKPNRGSKKQRKKFLSNIKTKKTKEITINIFKVIIEQNARIRSMYYFQKK